MPKRKTGRTEIGSMFDIKKGEKSFRLPDLGGTLIVEEKKKKARFTL